ncbi:hypothetical protein V5799_003982 [Amblyomma americanum]|uniref:N-acetylneuraminate lyase n=1 Tax=Amblyomma americanum TaxID=6943 RepID=A0AAQ4D7E8_AMBAM
MKKQCPALLVLVARRKKQILEITKLDLSHNHEVSAEIYQSYPERRRLTEEERNYVQHLLELHVPPRTIIEKLYEKYEEHHLVTKLVEIFAEENPCTAKTKVVVVDIDFPEFHEVLYKLLTVADDLRKQAQQKLMQLTTFEFYSYGATVVERLCAKVLTPYACNIIGEEVKKAKGASAVVRQTSAQEYTVSCSEEGRDVDTSRIEDYVKLLQQQSVTGAFVNGTTGEGLSLTVAERKDLAEAWVKASRGRLDLLIVHITAASVIDTQELAAHAEGLNVDAISILPPFYYRCPSNEHLIRYIEAVSKAAPNTPIIYYHIPSFTCVDVRMSDFLPEAKLRVPALCGAKYSCTDMSDLAGFLRADKAETKIFFGYEEV